MHASKVVDEPQVPPMRTESHTVAAGAEISISEMMPLFRSFESWVFRLETLPKYLVSGEEVFTEAYERGDKTAPDGLEGWSEVIRAATSKGKSWQIVRVVPEPVTAYFSMSVEWGYKLFEGVGQDTRFITQKTFESLVSHNKREDFWLFDGSSALRMVYSSNGEPVTRFLHRDETVLGRYNELRRLVLEQAKPLSEFLREFKPVRKDYDPLGFEV